MNSSPSHRELDVDRQIDRTLAAIGQTEPTPGLNARLLQALHQHQTSRNLTSADADIRQRTGEIRSFAWWQRNALRTLVPAATAALLALAVLPLLHRPEHTAKPSLRASKRSSPASQGRPTAPDAPDLTLLTPTTPGAPSSPTVLSSAKVGSPPPIHLEATLQPPTSTGTSTPNSTPTGTQALLDQQALSDFHAPSQPPPPTPPTDQERLVRLMLRRGEKVELAELDPLRRAATADGERAAFRDFFDPPVDPKLLDPRLLDPKPLDPPAIPAEKGPPTAKPTPEQGNAK